MLKKIWCKSCMMDWVNRVTLSCRKKVGLPCRLKATTKSLLVRLTPTFLCSEQVVLMSQARLNFSTEDRCAFSLSSDKPVLTADC